jgi:hypothetical protein
MVEQVVSAGPREVHVDDDMYSFGQCWANVSEQASGVLTADVCLGHQDLFMGIPLTLLAALVEVGCMDDESDISHVVERLTRDYLRGGKVPILKAIG